MLGMEGEEALLMQRQGMPLCTLPTCYAAEKAGQTERIQISRLQPRPLVRHGSVRQGQAVGFSGLVKSAP